MSLNSVKPKIICLSRSYLSKLLPTLSQHDDEFEYLHIVQTDKEEQAVKALGGQVVLNMQSTIRKALVDPTPVLWAEPADFREMTGFDWSAVYSDRYLVHFKEPERLLIAGALQHATEAIFDEHKFEGFLGEPVALFISHLIFYHCCKKDVKPLLWCNTYFSDHFYFSAESEISTPVRFQALNEENAGRLHEKIDEYVNGIIGDRTGPIYHHSFSGAKQDRLGYFKQRKGESPLVLRPGWTSRFIQLARLMRASWHRMNFRNSGDFMTAGAVSEHKFYLGCLFASSTIYDSLPEDPIDNNVVYPLQYEPEASLLYFAPYIVSQISFVETVLKALPDQRILWVKEHPNQFGALDTTSWRKLKARYSNLRFIHGRQNGRELIKRCSLAVTISSSMGLDALLLGRTLLVAGKVFYDRFTGSIQTRSYEDLARELNKLSNYIPQNNAATNTAELVEFGRHAYPGDPQPSHYLYEKRNLSLLVRAIQTELRPGLEAKGQ